MLAALQISRQDDKVTLALSPQHDLVLTSTDETQVPVTLSYEIKNMSVGDFNKFLLKKLNNAAFRQPVRCTNIEVVKGLPFITRMHESKVGFSTGLLMTNIPLDEDLVYNVPLPGARIYRDLDDVDTDVLEVRFRDSFDRERCPAWWRGYTHVVLHFRQTWNNFSKVE